MGKVWSIENWDFSYTEIKFLNIKQRFENILYGYDNVLIFVTF